MNIIELAREADCIDFRDDPHDPHVKQTVDFLERFAALVLEEAANAVDAMKSPDGYNIQEKSLYDVATMEAADVIRALKGEKE